MDLRVRKTEHAICTAFLELRAHKPLERITVRELCDRAQVGKATFYLHYHDIYDLSDTLQRALVEEILADISRPELIVLDTPEFTRQFAQALFSRRERIEVLFAGSQQGVLPHAIEQGIRAYLFELLPERRNDVRLNVLLTYQIQGGFYAYSTHATGVHDDEVFGAMLEAAELIGRAWG